MSEIKTRTRSPQNNTINQPTVMDNALAVIFAVNTLLSWIECTFSNPMNQHYFKYLGFTNHLPAKWLLIGAIIVSLIAIFLIARHIFGDVYLDYALLMLDIWIITYYFSPKFTATNTLVLINGMLTITFFALGVAATIAKNSYVKLRTYIMIGIGIAIITPVLAYFMYVKTIVAIISILLTFAIVLLAYVVQKPLCHYLEDNLPNNLNAIFKLPQFLVQALRTR